MVLVQSGQPDMEGQGVVKLDHPQYHNGGNRTVQRVMRDPDNAKLFSHVKDNDGKCIVRCSIC